MGIQPQGAESLRRPGGVAAKAEVFPAHHRPRAIALHEHRGKIRGRGLGHPLVKGQGDDQFGPVFLQKTAPLRKRDDELRRAPPDKGPGMGLEGERGRLKPPLRRHRGGSL